MTELRSIEWRLNADLGMKRWENSLNGFVNKSYLNVSRRDYTTTTVVQSGLATQMAT